MFKKRKIVETTTNLAINRDQTQNRKYTKKLIELKSGSCISAIFLSLFKSNILLLLNKYNEPIKIYADYKASYNFVYLMLPKNKTFNEILNEYKPSTIYANNGEKIKQYMKKSNCTVNLINSNVNLLEFLKIIKIENKPHLSFKEAKELDSTITFKEYKKIFHAQ